MLWSFAGASAQIRGDRFPLFTILITFSPESPPAFSMILVGGDGAEKLATLMRKSPASAAQRREETMAIAPTIRSYEFFMSPLLMIIISRLQSSESLFAKSELVGRIQRVLAWKAGF